MYALAVSAVSAAIVWRLLRRRAPAWAARLAPAASIAITALVVGLGAGPFSFHPKPWNATRFDESLTGQILRTNGITRGIVSMSGEAQGTQRALVRADLLFKPGHVLRTAFQLEYLPSGTMCRGKVSHIQSFGFSATCRLPDGKQRLVSTRWESSGTSELANGVISVRPN
jgi:hypothetical protein